VVVLGFLQIVDWFAGCEICDRDAAHASILVAALFCLPLSLLSVGVVGSYMFFLWMACPLLGDILSLVLPQCIGPYVFVFSFALPWLLQSQYFVLAMELFCALTMRSGTTIPGDAIQGGAVAFLFGLNLLFSAGFALALPRRRTRSFLGIAFCIGLCLAACTFPYSYDRPKRIYMQDVARSGMIWDFSQGPESTPAPFNMESGLWTCAMDWNNVATIEESAPFGLPPGSERVNDSVGVYGELPFVFPIKAFVTGGSWAPGAPPALPSALKVRMSSIGPETGGEKQLRISVWGGPQVMLALGPRSAITRWSFGHAANNDKASKAASATGELPDGLPPPRDDCDCYWVLFNEGGVEPTRGRAEAFNFTVAVKPGDLRMDIWSTHLETVSPRIQAHQQRLPHWVSMAGWVSELQVHNIRV